MAAERKFDASGIRSELLRILDREFSVVGEKRENSRDSDMDQSHQPDVLAQYDPYHGEHGRVIEVGEQYSEYFPSTVLRDVTRPEERRFIRGKKPRPDWLR